MKYALTTTAKTVLDPDDEDRRIKFSAGNVAAGAADIYIRPVGTLNPWVILHLAGSSQASFMVPHGTQLEALTDQGTADLIVIKTCCSSSHPEQ